MKNKLNTQRSTGNSRISTVIVANGKFPEHELPFKTLMEADIVVCCDGAISQIDKRGIIPTAIVGDLDSLSSSLRNKYADKLFPDPDQDSNDLTKAVKWCLSKGFNNIDVIGATGLREDHTIGNIGLLPFYAKMGMSVRMLTDNGVIFPLLESNSVESFRGQQISIFSPNNTTKITSTNLKYSIKDRTLEEYWMGTLNESLGDTFYLEFTPGPLVLFLKNK